MEVSSFSTAVSWRTRRSRFVALIAAPMLMLAMQAAAGAAVRCVSASGPIPLAQVKQYGCKPPVFSTDRQRGHGFERE